MSAEEVDLKNEAKLVISLGQYFDASNPTQTRVFYNNFVAALAARLEDHFPGVPLDFVEIDKSKHILYAPLYEHIGDDANSIAMLIKERLPALLSSEYKELTGKPMREFFNRCGP